MKVSVLLVLFCAALSLAESRLKSSKQLKVFQEKGCANCHKIHNVSEYTDYGKWARDKGYGCTTLLSLIKLHNVKGPDMERAREVFFRTNAACVIT
ncbi:MAG: hypothetical protein ACO2PP_20740 [Thermocrinis sp.]|jgi:hypothetical protein|uniref:hypothetical protein n=1 Tax=Thermocrinis sp. TaxID=2024383 RepID=UPI003C0436D6